MESENQPQTPEPTVYYETQPKDRRLLYLGLGGVGIVAFIVAIFLLTKKKSTSSGTNDTSTSTNDGKYLPETGKIYAITSEAVSGDLGSWWQLGTTELNLANAEYCGTNKQQFKFVKLADTGANRATYRIQNCNTGTYLSAYVNNGATSVKGAALNSNDPLQTWELVQISQTSSVHTKTTDATTIGVFAINNISAQKTIEQNNTVPILNGWDWDAKINQRWTIHLIKCTTTC